MISKRLRRIAADSNVLLSAVIGKAALRVLLRPEIEVITTGFNLNEVFEYLPRLASKYSLDHTALVLQLKMLPVTFFREIEYKTHMAEAAKWIKHRDPDDIALLALALKERVPIWSNDKDFENLPVQAYTTNHLLRILER